jgi:acetyl-CoA carboxylase carboxyl transferase alpha subunit/acetyl-CoA carboxylase carboxyl transferase beta subunit
VTATREAPPRTAAVPDWARCVGCGALHYRKKMARNLGVCPVCGLHGRLPAVERVAQLTDHDSFVPLGARVRATDVLSFTDTQPYSARLAKARAATGLDDAVLAGTARIGGHPLVIAAMDFRFMGGSLGAAAGEVITASAEAAFRLRLPLLVVTASGGARMQEGVIALMQMAKISQALAVLRAAGLPSVSLVTDPTYGGVAASFATSCDVVLIEQGARMGFAGPRVIENTIRQRLPEDFQTAGFLLAHGLVDAVAHRADLRGWLSRLFASIAPAGPDVPVVDPGPPGAGSTPRQPPPALDPPRAVAAARDTARPTARDYLAGAFTGFVELHGDRTFADCPSVVAGFAQLAGQPVAVIGLQKGHNTKELVRHNFGMPRPEGYRKALRVMRLAARLGVPIVTIVDTPGAYPGVDAEERGQSNAIAESILGMFELRVPVVTVVTGEGGSGGALALAVADRVLMFQRSTYSVISPEGCSAILWGDSNAAADAARALRITSRELLELAVVDEVLPEPSPDGPPNSAAMVATLRDAVARSIAELSDIDADSLVLARRNRFRSFGANAISLRWTEEAAR